MIFTLPFDTPSKKNSRVTDTRTGRSFPNKKFTEWHKKAVAYLRLNFIKDCLKALKDKAKIASMCNAANAATPATAAVK